MSKAEEKLTMEDFKKVLADNLFAATRTEELPIGRLFEVVDTTAPYIIEAAKQYMMKDAIEAEIINWASMFTSIKVLEPERAEAMIKEKFNIGDKVKLIVIKED